MSNKDFLTAYQVQQGGAFSSIRQTGRFERFRCPSLRPPPGNFLSNSKIVIQVLNLMKLGWSVVWSGLLIAPLLPSPSLCIFTLIPSLIKLYVHCASSLMVYNEQDGLLKFQNRGFVCALVLVLCALVLPTFLNHRMVQIEWVTKY